MKINDKNKERITKSLEVQISLIYSKYKSVKDENELIYLLSKEFKTDYNKKDILNYYVGLTELELEDRKIHYGYFNEYQNFITE